MTAKSKKVNIHRIDPLGADHRKLIQTLSCCGVGRSFHDPNTGTSLIFTHDELSRDLWHEGAHSFLTQRGPSGLLFTIYSNALHVLFKELQDPKLKDDDRNRVSTAINRLLHLRNSFCESMALSHEVFAIGTEMRAMSNIAFSKGGGPWTEIEKRLVSLISPIAGDVENQGKEIHKKALNVLKLFAEVYGFPDIAESIAEAIILNLPSLITNVKPSTLLFGKEEEITSVHPDVKQIYGIFLENPPKWAKSMQNVEFFYGVQEFIGLGHYKSSIMQIVSDLMRAYSVYGNIFNNGQKFGEWIQEFVSLLPISPQSRGLFQTLMGEAMKYTLSGGDRKKERLKQFVKYEKVSKKDYDQLKKDNESLINELNLMSKELEEAGIELPKRDELILMNDPLALPPPVSLLMAQGKLNLLVRSDLNCRGGIDFLSYQFIENELVEFVFSDFKNSKPFICLYYHSRFKDNTCGEREGNCRISLHLRDIMKFSNQSKKNQPPLLICCRKDFALIISFLPDNDYKPEILMRCPFEIVDLKPELKGYRFV
jgi:hypothetical protein